MYYLFTTPSNSISGYIRCKNKLTQLQSLNFDKNLTYPLVTNGHFANFRMKNGLPHNLAVLFRRFRSKSSSKRRMQNITSSDTLRSSNQILNRRKACLQYTVFTLNSVSIFAEHTIRIGNFYYGRLLPCQILSF